MSALLRTVAVCAVVFTLGGCGATVGDPCTLPTECANQLCINNQSYTPGGYCSKQCTIGNESTCPGGSTCIRAGAGALDACFRLCKVNEDCRSGYICDALGGGTVRVCMGASS